MATGTVDARKDTAKAWFETLRDQIVAAFEAIEHALAVRRAVGRPRRGPL